MANNFSPAKIFGNVMRTPAQAVTNHDIDTWFTPVASPRPSDQELGHFFKEDMTVEQLVKKLKDHNHDLHGHHLTSVIAGLDSQKIFTLKPEDFKPTIPSVIAPVSMTDFKDFLQTTKGKTERFFGKKKKPEQPRGRTGSSSGLTDSTGRSIFDFREPLEQWQEDTQVNPQEVLDQCYVTVPENFFSLKIDPVSDSAEVLILIDRTTELKQQMDQENNYDYDYLESEITNSKNHLGDHLSEQLDLVERALFAQTTSKADTIFQTVTNLHSLQSMVALESGRVAGLRTHIADLRAVTTTGRAQVLSLQRRRSNATALKRTLEAIKNVSMARGTMDKLLAANDYTAAFQVLEQALQTLDGELNGVVALRTLARQFREMKEVIGGEMADTFVRVSCDRLDTAQNQAMPSSQSAKDKDEEVKRYRATLGPLIRGMCRKGNLRDALAKHRTRLLELIKNTAKLVVAQTLESIPQEQRSDALREMKTGEFVSFLRSTFEGLEIILTRAELVHNVVTASLPSSASQGSQGGQARSARKPSSYMMQQQKGGIGGGLAEKDSLLLSADELRDITSVSASVVLRVRESAQLVVVRLLSFRDDQHSQLGLSEYKVIYDAIQGFILSSGEPATELKAALAKQSSALLTSLDDRTVAKLRTTLDSETWESLPAVPKDVQSLVDRLEKTGKVLLNDIQMEDGTRGNAGHGPDPTERRFLVVGSRNVKVTTAAITMIKNLQDYVRCALMFPTVAFQAATKAFDCLFLYDERIRRLILGAEVKQKGRLQTIGSKHLAMASQSLTALYCLLNPLCKAFVDSVPPQQQTKVEDDLFRRVEKTMLDHIYLIGDTLVSLISSEINKLGQNIQRMDWDTAGVQGLDAASPYMADFCEKLNKLHTVLQGNLDRQSLEDVFQGVTATPGHTGYQGIFSRINGKIPQFFDSINPTTPAGQMRIRVDIASLVSSLRRLRTQAGPGFDPGTPLEQWVNGRYGNIG